MLSGPAGQRVTAFIFLKTVSFIVQANIFKPSSFFVRLLGRRKRLEHASYTG